MKSAHVRGKDGNTLWIRRHGDVPGFTEYPFGALAFVRLSKELETKRQQFQARMIPNLLVGIGSGPGCTWDKNYMIVRLDKMFGDRRASRVNIRRSADVMFPERPTSPLKTTLKAAGAQGDENLLGLAVSDSNEDWELHNGGEESDEEVADGMLGENRPKLID